MQKKSVFITWSGSRSKAVAEALRNWLPKVLQAIDAWISADIEKGTHWQQALSQRLESSDFGIICLTPDNLSAPWILFEAGAISKKAASRTCTYLYQLESTDVRDPLAQFQHTRATEQDTRQLLKSLNTELGEDGIETLLLDEAFELWWPKLEQALQDVPAAETAPNQRSTDDKVDEILTHVRELKNNAPIHREPHHLGVPLSLVPPATAVSEAISAYERAMDLLQQIRQSKDVVASWVSP